MYQSIQIERFRGLSSLEISKLSRVNLVVGKNNAGKTSILEAIEIVALGGRPVSLLRSPSRRGEVPSEASDSRILTEYDIRHLFYQHAILEGAYFRISAKTEESDFTVKCEVRRAESETEELKLFPDEDEIEIPLEVLIKGPENREGTPISVSPSGILRGELLRNAIQIPHSSQPSIAFLGTEGAKPALLQRLWDRLVLTREEEKIVHAMQIIEPNIERIAFTNRDSRWPAAAWVKLRDDDHRVPLGSLGDGIRRLLALAIYVARASGGVLLVDEIDTGLHFSTLELMWKFIVESAIRLDVQVFATSHSGDCLRALAWLESDMPELAQEVSVHRVERGHRYSERYSANDIEVAIRHDIEVRG
jgi:AAA15 family ATPase/GTPase